VWDHAGYTFTAVGAVGQNVNAQGHITVNASFGSGSYSYAFSKVSGYGNLFNPSGDQATVAYGSTITAAPQTYAGVFKCVITDTVYGATQTIQVTVNFDFNSNI
jgi:hypothetical protein